MDERRHCPDCGSELTDDATYCPNCSTQVGIAPPALGLPALEGYETLKELGAGAMGTVYLAKDKYLDRRVAIKLISAELLDNAGARARFRREARVMANVEHPNVVRLYSMGSSQGIDFLVMEFVDGQSLADLLRTQVRFAWQEALVIVRQVAEGLEAAWAREVVHRDVKPSNILIDGKGRAMVTDFGLSKSVASGHSDSVLNTTTGAIVGTPLYMSPEQVRGEALDFRSDLYSLGLVLFELVSGKRPYDADTAFTMAMKHLHEPLPDLTALAPDAPPGLVSLVNWLTTKNRGLRPGSYNEVLEAVDGLLATSMNALAGASTAQLETLSGPVEAIERTPRPRLGLAIAAISVVTLAGASILALSVVGYLRAEAASAESMPTATDSRGFVIAIAPFAGPDSESTKEGLVLARLVEKELLNRISDRATRVLGIDMTRDALRSHEAARELGSRLHASAVLWGEVISIRGETEISPRVALLPAVANSTQRGNLTDGEVTKRLKAGFSFSGLQELEGPEMSLAANVPSQIELRKSSARDVSDLALFVLALHELYVQGAPEKASKILNSLPDSPQVLRYRGEALALSQHESDAIPDFRRAVELQPDDADLRARLADALFRSGRKKDAIRAYEAAQAAGGTVKSTEAALFRGLLYRAETYIPRSLTPGRTRPSLGEPRSNLYVTAENPDTGEIRERHLLVGAPIEFRSSSTKLEIDSELTLFSVKELPTWTETTTIGLDGVSNRPEVLSAPNLIPRIPKNPVLSDIGWNFLYSRLDVTCPRPFQLRGDFLDLSGPTSVDELETRLRQAVARDPTQPWAQFLLAEALAAKRLQSAKDVFERLLQQPYSATPYSDWAWMADYAECWNQPDWSDRLLDRARSARARLTLPRLGTTAIERAVSVPMKSSAFGSNPGLDLHRRFRKFQTLLEITGPSLGVDSIVARAWRVYFEARGESAAAEQARGLEAIARAHPLSIENKTADLDRSLALGVGVLAGSVLWILGLLVSASRRPSPAWASDRPLSSRSPWRSMVAQGVTTIVVGGLLALGISAISGGLVRGEAPIATVSGLVLALALFQLIRRVDSRKLTAMVRRQPGLVNALGAMSFLAGAAGIVISWSAIQLSHTFSLPAGGLSDALDHPAVRAYFATQEPFRSDPSFSFFRAVGAHLWGDKVEAKRQYSLAGNSSRIIEDLGDLNGGRPPRQLPELADLVGTSARWTRLPLVMTSVPGVLNHEVEWVLRPAPLLSGRALVCSCLALCGLALIALGLATWLRLGAPALGEVETNSQDGDRGRLQRICDLTLPGWAYLKLGQPTLALAVSIGVFTTVATVYLLLANSASPGAIGPVSADYTNLLDGSMWPAEGSDASAVLVASRWIRFWAYPHQVPLLAILGVVGALSLVAMLLSFQRLRRSP